MDKRILSAIGIFALVLIVVFFIRSDPQGYDSSVDASSEENLPLNENIGTTEDTNDEVQNEPGDNTEISEPQELPNSNTITLQELQSHNNENDCWVVYKGKVYDVTDYIPRHPGGESRIARNCGTAEDFERDFTNKHGTSKVNLLMNVGTFIGDFDVIGDFN